MSNYNALVDHQVSNMAIHSTKDSKESTDNLEAPFDTEAYANYKEQVKQFQLNTNGNLIEMILQLGFKLDQTLDKIINQLDTVIERIDKD